MSHVEAGGVTLHVEEHGPAEGDPILLIAGVATPGHVWQTYQVPALAKAGYRLITLDNRGTPPSDTGEGFTRDDMVADAAGVIEALGIGPCRVIGQSLGALITQELLTTRPELITQAVLMATYGRSDALRTAVSKAELELCDARTAIPRPYEAVIQAVQNLSRHTLNDDQRIGDWLDILEFSPQAPKSRSQIEASIAENRLDAYRGITAPCLVIAFGDDLAAPPHLGREVADHIPGAEYVEIAECGHYGYLERPDAVNEAIIGFFGRAPRAEMVT